MQPEQNREIGGDMVEYILTKDVAAVHQYRQRNGGVTAGPMLGIAPPANLDSVRCGKFHEDMQVTVRVACQLYRGIPKSEMRSLRTNNNSSIEIRIPEQVDPTLRPWVALGDKERGERTVRPLLSAYSPRHCKK